MIEGTRTAAKPRSGGAAPNRETTRSVYRLPAHDAEFEKWRASNRRLARFARACKMNGEKARLFCFYDTTVRQHLILDLYQRPVWETFLELERLAETGADEKAIRERLDRVHRLMLVWEYIRETSWYTAGPTADVLSAWQLAELYGHQIYGRMQEAAREEGDSIWKVVPDDEMTEHHRQSMRRLAERVGTSIDQLRPLEEPFERYERLEHQYLAAFLSELADVQARAARGDNSVEIYRAFRSMQANHELFLYYQSISNVPRWTLLIQHAPTAPFARWVVEARRNHYERAVNADARDDDSGSE